MLADQPRHLGLRRRVQRIIGGAHVGELGVAAAVGRQPARQQRIPRRNGTERTVRMPEPVAKVEQPPAVVARQRSIILTQVGYVVHPLRQPMLPRLRHVATTSALDHTEMNGERHLLRVGERLVMEHQNSKPVHPRLDRRHFSTGQRARKIHAGNLAHKARAKGLNGQSHDSILLNIATTINHPCAAVCAAESWPGCEGGG